MKISTEKKSVAKSVADNKDKIGDIGRRCFENFSSDLKISFGESAGTYAPFCIAAVCANVIYNIYDSNDMELDKLTDHVFDTIKAILARIKEIE